MQDNFKKSKKEFVKVVIIIIGIILYSIGLKWFVAGANILPSGFTGVSFFIQKLVLKYFKMDIGLTITNVIFNLIPAFLAYKIIGKRFTIISFIIMFAFTFVADLIPIKILTTEPLLASIFGGITCGFGSSLWYRCGVSGGGTDFVALSLSQKYHIQTFNYIMGFNIVLIVLQGIIYGFEPAFYSIIYQFVCTQAINMSYRHYETRTIFIVTDKPDLVGEMLMKESGHSSTIIKGIGSYTKSEKYILYTVVTQPEVRKLTNIIKKYDEKAFLNVMVSNEVLGNFKFLPVDIDDIDQNL